MRAKIVRKATDVKDYYQSLKEFTYQESEIEITKTIIVSDWEYMDLSRELLKDRKYITENIDSMYFKDGAWHGILVKTENGKQGIFIESEGFDYARYMAVIKVEGK